MYRRTHHHPLTVSRGFTLIELMVAIGIVAILAAIAFPNFQQTIRSNGVATSTNQLIAAVALARSEAVRTSRGSGICASDNGTSCGADWSRGFLVWADSNANGTFESATDTPLRFVQSVDNVQIAGPGASNALRFDGRGRLIAEQVLTVRPEECGGEPMLRRLEISPTGQIRKRNAPETCL